MQVVDLGDQGVILDKLLLLLLSLLFDLVTALLDLLHEVVVGANAVTQIHEKAVCGQLEATALLLDPRHGDGPCLVKSAELMLAGLDPIGLLDALLIAFLEHTFQSLNLFNEAIRTNDVLQVLQQASLVLVLGLGSHE